LAISLSQGDKWKVLISKYIGTIPVNGDASCAAKHCIPGMPPSWIPVRSAMIAKAGAAARDSKQSALALGHSRRCPTSVWTKGGVSEIISRIVNLVVNVPVAVVVNDTQLARRLSYSCRHACA
jgi:hypothetical protein